MSDNSQPKVNGIRLKPPGLGLSLFPTPTS